MIKQILCVYDSKAAAFSDPFFAVNVAVALRQFAAACNDPALDINRFHEDYSLYHVGSFDTDLGEFTLHQPMQKIAQASSCIVPPEVKNAS